jgi:hypothetical protein
LSGREYQDAFGRRVIMVFSTFAGAFGGIFPNVLRLAMILIANGEDKIPSYTYLYGLILFAILGAGVVYFWQETDFKKAVYLGIGLPSFLQLGITNGSDIIKKAELLI